MKDPEHDIKRKINLYPDGLQLCWSSDGLLVSVMAGYEGHRGWINYLAVHPDYRKRGLGRKMMEAAEEYLNRFNCPKINLQVWASKHEAIEFYERIGYRTEDIVNMGKRLITDNV